MNLEGFDDYRDWPNITPGLVARGYSEEDIRKVIGAKPGRRQAPAARPRRCGSATPRSTPSAVRCTPCTQPVLTSFGLTGKSVAVVVHHYTPAGGGGESVERPSGALTDRAQDLGGMVARDEVLACHR